MTAKKTPEQLRADAAERKRKSRERLAKFGVKRVEVGLSESERETLAMLCQVRAGEGKEPYSVDEYISTLIRRDKERLDEQLKFAQCNKCKLPLPGGCNGNNVGSPECYKFALVNRLSL